MKQRTFRRVVQDFTALYLVICIFVRLPGQHVAQIALHFFNI